MSSEVRVLHVEDEPDFADLTATFPERTDDRLSVETAHDADAALARLANDIDCIVADYDLPAHTGIELLEAVRADHPDLPFILYTGKGSEAVASEAISAGVTDYLQKGTGTDQYTVLANRITNAVENSRTKAALERSEERYRRLVDEAPVPIVVYEESGAILDANDAALETLDIAASGDGLDVNVFELVHPDTRDRCRRRVQRLIENGETLESIRLEVTTQQGTSRILTGSSTAIRYDGQPAVQTIAYDVTDRERRTAKLQRLHEATRSFIQCESPQAVCDAAVEAATDVLSLPMCTIWLHDEATTTLQPASSTQTARETFGQAPVYEPGNSLSWQVYWTGESVFYSSVGEHEGAYNQETIVGAELIVPLGEHGVINLASTDEGELTELDQSLADIFAANVTAALDRASREQSRKESERRFRALFEQSADPMYIHDDEGEITAVNDRACEVTGYEREALLGMQVSELQAARDHEELKDRWDTMEAGDIWEGTGRHRRTDGETFPVEVRVSRIESTDGGQFLAIARDITDRQRHQQAVQALHDATRDLFRADDPETVAERVAEACHTALGFQNNVVRLVDDGERLQPVAVSQGAQTVLGDRPTYPVGEGTAGQAFEAGRTLVYDDVQTIDDGYDRGDAQAGMYVPIGEHGTLSINSTTREEFDATDRQLAETLAANAHVALERLDRRAERRRRERAIEELHRMTPELTRAESKQAVAEMITTAVRDVLGHSETGVRLRTEDGTRLESVAMSSASKAKLGDRPTYCVGEGTAGEAFQAQETLVYDDLSTVDDEYDRGGSRAGLYVLIEDHGTITVAADQVGAFDDEDIKLTEILAANAAAALDRVDRLTELERQNERLDEFATIVSHDLRNPLNVATGQLKLAQTDPDPDRIEQALSALGRVESLLSDLLTYAREGRDIGDRTAVGLAEVAQRAWATATTGDATVQVETTRTVHADRTRLRQVLENLFSNSVEHGGPDVTVTVGATDDGFYVADDGPGIPAAERENVFDGGYTTGDAGSGLGLAIVADIVRAHGWTITVTDSEAGGARFDVTGTER